MGLKRGVSGLAVASSNCSAGIVRKAAREVAPTILAKFTPNSSAWASEAAGCKESIDPLSPIAAAIRFLDSGEAIWAQTEEEPADSPAMVTFLGSPPKAAMFCCTHLSAAL